MTRVIWNEPGARFYEDGVDRGIVYPHGAPAEPWDGLISVKSSPLGGDPNAFFLDGEKFSERSAPEEFAASVECFIYPESLDDHIFDFCYRTGVGNDVDGQQHAYILHFVYNAMISVPDLTHTSRDDDPELDPITLDISVKPPLINAYKSSAHLYADIRFLNKYQIADLEALLYGSDDTEPTMLQPNELIQWFDDYRVLVIEDHGDGTWTATGPDDVVIDNGDGTWRIDWPSAVWLDSETWNLSTF